MVDDDDVMMQYNIVKHDDMDLRVQVNNIAELMANSDLAIGAGGTTTWERCCLGLPAIVIGVAENQIELSISCHESGVIVYLGKVRT